MPRMTHYRHGVPSWIDVSTRDTDGTARFYGGLFGWTLGEDLGPESGGYRMFLKDGLPIAGVGPVMGEGVPPSWTTYVTVRSADDAAAAITAHGGTIFAGPMDLPNESGRMLIAADPTGGVLGYMQPGAHIGSELVNEPGTLVWNELTVRDPDAALAFYSAVLGWTDAPMADGSPYRLISVDGRVTAGCMPMDDSWPAELPTHWMVYIAVEDTDATAARCTELGGSVPVPPTDIPIGRFAVLNDPEGAWLSVIALTGDIDDPNAWPD